MKSGSKILNLIHLIDAKKFVYDALTEPLEKLDSGDLIREQYESNDPPIGIISFISFDEELFEIFFSRTDNSNPQTYTIGVRGAKQIHSSDINNELLQIVIDHDIVCVETFDFGLKAYYKGFTNDKQKRDEFMYKIKELIDELL